MRHFTPTELSQYLVTASPPPVLLDVRENWEFEYCHLEGSIQIPMAQIPDRLVELDSKREIVLVCHHGIRSRQVAFYLEQHGFEQLINLDGGLERWARDVDPEMKTY